MSILLEHKFGWIVDHAKLIEKVYCGKNGISYGFDPDCFAIHFPFYLNSQLEKYVNNKDNQLVSAQQIVDVIKAVDKQKSKKRKRLLSDAVDELGLHDEQIQLKLQPLFDEIIKLGLKNGLFEKPPVQLDSVKNLDARFFSEKVKKISKLHFIKYGLKEDENCSIVVNENMTKLTNIDNKNVYFNGGNASVLEIDKNNYVIPPNCRIINSNIEDFEKLIGLENETYDFIVIDPPWSNKCVKRKKCYETLDHDAIKNLPICKLANDGALIAIWVTNKPYHMKFIEEELFPFWNVKFCSLWHWLKVSRSGDLICDWNSPRKKPYEHLYIGQKMGLSKVTLLQMNETKIIVSVPSAIHSHKPPLIEILWKYLKLKSKSLDIFARYLLPNCTSWGNQVLLLQHLELYKPVQNVSSS